MKFTISSHALSESAKCVIKACAFNANNPILSGVKLETRDGMLVMTATNGSESVRRIDHAYVEEEGQTVISGRMLLSIAKGLPDASVSFEDDGPVMTMSCKKAKYRLNTMDPSEFPEFPVVEDSQSIELSATLFATIVDKVSKCASKDTSRPVLGGVRVTASDGNLVLCATDSYRFATANTASDGEFDAIIPANALRDAIGMVSDTVNIYGSDRQACITSGSTTYVTRLLEGNFPDTSKIMPNAFSTLMTFEPEEFFDAVRRVEVTAKDSQSVKVSMSMTDMFVQLQSSSPTEGESTDVFAGSVEGNDVTIAFNVNFIKDAIAGCDGESTLELNGPLQPAVFRSHGDIEYMMLLMPVRM